MAQYLSPGVYVEEVPSAIKPIAGVSTSTAGFIGVVADPANEPLAKLTGATLASATAPRRFSPFPSTLSAGTKSP